MTAEELVSRMWAVGGMDAAAALVERWGEERWQLGYDLGWKHCEDRERWYKVERNL